MAGEKYICILSEVPACQVQDYWCGTWLGSTWICQAFWMSPDKWYWTQALPPRIGYNTLVGWIHILSINFNGAHAGYCLGFLILNL